MCVLVGNLSLNFVFNESCHKNSPQYAKYLISFFCGRTWQKTQPNYIDDMSPIIKITFHFFDYLALQTIESEEQQRLRFQVELEFVQCLANPNYLHCKCDMTLLPSYNFSLPPQFLHSAIISRIQTLWTISNISSTLKSRNTRNLSNIQCVSTSWISYKAKNFAAKLSAHNAVNSSMIKQFSYGNIIHDEEQRLWPIKVASSDGCFFISI